MLTLIPILYRAHSAKTEAKYDLTLFFLTGQRGHRGERQKHRCIVHLVFIMLSAYRSCECLLFAELPHQDFKTGQENLRDEHEFIYPAVLPPLGNLLSGFFLSHAGLKVSSNVFLHRYIPNY